MRLPPDLPPPRKRKMLASTLAAFGTVLMREVRHPWVMAMFRLAVTEAERSPDVAEALDAARDGNRRALADLLARAQSGGLIGVGEPLEMARQYLGLFWEDFMITLLLQLSEPPASNEIELRASKATAAFLKLHT